MNFNITVAGYINHNDICSSELSLKNGCSMFYKNSTEPGQSGGPVYIWSGEDAVIIGVHSGYSPHHKMNDCAFVS